MKKLLGHAPILGLCAVLFGQSAEVTTSPSALHVVGSITECGKAIPRLWVTFRGDTNKTVRANDTGAYEADLPPGIWTAITIGIPTETADNRSLSRPRHFRVTAPGTIVLNLNLRPPVLCDLAILSPDGHPPTPEEISHRDLVCWGEEFFPAPSTDGVPFEVDLFGLTSSWDSGYEPCTLVQKNKVPHREFATYNLLSVQANRVAYDRVEKILEADGDVIVQDQAGERRASSVSFKIQDGTAIPLR
jgi:hypothetical protein